MNNAPTIINYSLSATPAEIEPLYPRNRLSIGRVTNCLRRPETIVASIGGGLSLAAGIAFGLGANVAATPLVIAGSAMLLLGGVTFTLKHYCCECYFAEDTENPPPPPPPSYAEIYNGSNAELPTYEEWYHFFRTSPPEYEESCTLSSTPPQLSPSPTNEDDSPLQNTLPGLQFTYLV